MHALGSWSTRIRAMAQVAYGRPGQPAGRSPSANLLTRYTSNQGRPYPSLPVPGTSEACRIRAARVRLATFVRMPDHLVPSMLDGGGCWLLHESHRYAGMILYANGDSVRAS